ncbi:MAG TPA: hypothetical protein VK726_16250 [Acetobacteraceae bacterium]|nr:hypothetical protein [Acetobacteraceae bacterium]
MLTSARLTTLATVKPFVRRLIGVVRYVRGGYVSIAITAAILVAAGYTLPWRPGPGTVPPIWRVPKDTPPLAVGTELPVFCLPATGLALRCGIARMRDGGQIGFVPYGELPNPHDALPVLATADIGLLWALADPAARAQVQASAAALATQMVASVRSVTDSEAWRYDYRESLQGLLDRASQAAWRADDTQRAFRALLRASEPMMQDSLTHQIGPAIAPFVADAFWNVVKTNSGQVLSLMAGQPLDLSPISSALSLALQDPRTQAALGHTGPRIMDLPQSELLFERMASNMADALQRDPETSALLTRIAMDPRLGDELGHVRNHLAQFMHQLGEVLWGLGSGSSMNSLAGLSVKTEIVGQSQPLILLIDTDDAATLVHTLPGRATLLVPETLR